MNKLYFCIVILLFFTGCSSDTNNSSKREDLFYKDIAKSIEEATLESDHYECVTNKKYYFCESLSFLYGNGGLFKGKEIKKNPEKAKEYNKILCEEFKKEFYCEKLKNNNP
ncbi:hypothetical protein CBLAS_1087 [Campylobacter blaseri]|uniref:Lipoprotein n=1 Tax=Campylobacter blaseri TaxID=2042961 RepID=A0A2P8QZI6_9BACT|nr:hypothetical protein [Campylobacter blaseri]PSM51666.1 hypothetical protein CQ405_05915 [Campylobacter blaseri]PSM53456.1 hypothetical protein CRN67_05915 [Campylobacter blaseri]QKF86261.1 hypothetical protein CBLAS_1087 [Campylobacter blaseri]